MWLKWYTNIYLSLVLYIQVMKKPYCNVILEMKLVEARMLKTKPVYKWQGPLCNPQICCLTVVLAFLKSKEINHTTGIFFCRVVLFTDVKLSFRNKCKELKIILSFQKCLFKFKEDICFVMLLLKIVCFWICILKKQSKYSWNSENEKFSQWLQSVIKIYCRKSFIHLNRIPCKIWKTYLGKT